MAKAAPNADTQCLAASLFALQSGGIDKARQAVDELSSQHAQTMKFVIECGGVDHALARLKSLENRLSQSDAKSAKPAAPSTTNSQTAQKKQAA